MGDLIDDLHDIADGMSAEEYSEDAERIRDAIAEIERLRAAAVGAENETREALIADALETFQKRDGYHKEVIVDLLQDFGAVLLERAAVGAKDAAHA